ncbi:MAG: M28 family peptidase [Verrucomicrobia bacterium]|nr:M28 family peptidase [Verrucomicrobiota bacterium]
MSELLRSAFRIAVALAVVLGLVAGGLFYMSRCGNGGKGAAMNASPDEINQTRERLAAHVRVLAADIGERNVFHPKPYQRAADYIAAQFATMGYAVDWQRFEVEKVSCANLTATRPGQRSPEQIVVIGAHYDSVFGCPGANDNATGVAALLELARRFAPKRWGEAPPSLRSPETQRGQVQKNGNGSAEPRPTFLGSGSATLRFVAFANEEPPFFLTDDMGSRVYAKACRKRGDDIRAMVALETLGCYSEEKGSQRYPPLFNLFYPDRGNFIGFVGNLSSRSLIRQAATVFRGASDVPVETCATVGFVPGVNWSDHDSFWREGWRAFMVTDTAPYRYPHYHERTDTPDKISYDILARVTVGLESVVRELATGESF